MLNLLDLPTEILLAILSHLADVFLLDLFTTRRTCKRIHLLITSILSNSYSSHGHAINAFLKSQFAAILDTSSVENIRYLNGSDRLAPFRALPWASDAEVRAKYLRAEASWRRIPLASESGAIIRSLQVVMITSDDYPDKIDGFTGEDVIFLPEDGHEFEIVYSPPGGVTIGTLYDVIIGLDGIYPNPLGGGWRLLFETRVKDCKEFEKLSNQVWRGDIQVTSREVDDMFVHNERCALLVTAGGWPRGTEGWVDEEKLWRPMAIDDQAQMCMRFC